MVAHGSPWAALPEANLSAQIRSCSTVGKARGRDTATVTASTTALLAKEVSEMFANVPYIRGAAGLVVQILKVEDEMRISQNRYKELIDTICRHYAKIFQCLKRIDRSIHPEKHMELSTELEEHTKILSRIYEAQSEFASASVIMRFLKRSLFLEEIERYERQIDQLFKLFILSRLTQIELGLCESNTIHPFPAGRVFVVRVDYLLPKNNRPREPSTPLIPSKPPIFFGRDSELKSIVETLTQETATRVSILGPGGIGKTSLAKWVIDSSDVQRRYDNRYYISCETLLSIEHFLNALAEALCIPRQERDSCYLQSHIIDCLSRKSSLLCFDNFETLWEDSAKRQSIEKLLLDLSTISHLSIILTMRGTQHPCQISISWTSLPPLQTLKMGDALRIYEEISGRTPCNWTRRLFNAIDCLPLAVTLISHLGREESAESLWMQWKASRTRMVNIGGEDRLSNLDVSIRLSVFSLRMNEPCRQILALLSFLPGGLLDAQEMFHNLQSFLGGSVDIRNCINTLRRVSLIYACESHGTLRLQMLSPIREFCRNNLEVSDSWLTNLAMSYIQHVNTYWNYKLETSRVKIRDELANIRSVLLWAVHHFHGRSELQQQDDWTELVQAAVNATKHASYYGIHDDEMVQQAMEYTTVCVPLSQRANCHVTLGAVYMWQNQNNEAEQSFQCALKIQQRTGDIQEQGRVLRYIGDLYTRLGSLDKAETSLVKATELHKKTSDLLGLAHDYLFTGHLQLQRSMLDDAESSLQKALVLHRQVGCYVGQGWDHHYLGELLVRRGSPAISTDSKSTPFDKVKGSVFTSVDLSVDCVHANAANEFILALVLHRKAEYYYGFDASVTNLVNLNL